MVWEGTARDPVWDRGLTSQLLGTDYTQLVNAGHKEQGCNMGAGASLWLAARCHFSLFVRYMGWGLGICMEVRGQLKGVFPSTGESHMW